MISALPKNLIMEMDSKPWRKPLCLDDDVIFSAVLLDLDRLQQPTDDFVHCFLNATEQERLNTFSLAKRKTEWLGGRIAVKLAVARLLDGDTPRENQRFTDLAISPNAAGRPYINCSKKTTGSAPDISISHSHGMAAAMACSRGRCGIDIQQQTGKVFAIREKFITLEDTQFLDISDNPEGIRQLTRLWAAKEAVRKISGQAPLAGFLEIKLTDAKKIAPHEHFQHAEALDFSLSTRETGEKGKKKFRVVAMDCKEYALAMTICQA